MNALRIFGGALWAVVTLSWVCAALQVAMQQRRFRRLAETSKNSRAGEGAVSLGGSASLSRDFEPRSGGNQSGEKPGSLAGTEGPAGGSAAGGGLGGSLSAVAVAGHRLDWCFWTMELIAGAGCIFALLLFARGCWNRAAERAYRRALPKLDGILSWKLLRIRATGEVGLCVGLGLGMRRGSWSERLGLLCRLPIVMVVACPVCALRMRERIMLGLPVPPPDAVHGMRTVGLHEVCGAFAEEARAFWAGADKKEDEDAL